MARPRRKFERGMRNSEYLSKRREVFNIYHSKEKSEKLRTLKSLQDKKYNAICNVILKEVLKTENLTISYKSIYPIVKRAICNTEHIAKKYNENDIEEITRRVIHSIKSREEHDK